MSLDFSLSTEIINYAESFPDIRAGIIRTDDVLKGASYQVVSEGQRSLSSLDALPLVEWPEYAPSVLVLGLEHPQDDLPMDWWEGGDTRGNRSLRETSKMLKEQLLEKYGLKSRPLPYHVENGGVFLKDAAVLSGLGIIGRNNLLLHPVWGARIRLRSILIEGELQPTGMIKGFSPCETCNNLCHKACPVDAFSQGTYSMPLCRKQMRIDEDNKFPSGEINKNGKQKMIIEYCRACELTCPVGEKTIDRDNI